MDRRVNVKTGVMIAIDSLRPEVTRIITVAEVTAPMGYTPTITSGCDGTHKNGSKHYSGRAFDFRIKDLPEGTNPKLWANRMQSKLGDDYFVLLEETHIHAQWNG